MKKIFGLSIILAFICVCASASDTHAVAGYGLDGLTGELPPTDEFYSAATYFDNPDASLANAAIDAWVMAITGDNLNASSVAAGLRDGSITYSIEESGMRQINTNSTFGCTNADCTEYGIVPYPYDGMFAPTQLVTFIVKNSDGTTTEYSRYIKASCNNPIEEPESKETPAPNPPGDNQPDGGGVCCGANHEGKPASQPRPPDAPMKYPITRYGVATAVVTVGNASLGGSSVPDLGEDEIIDITPEQIDGYTASTDGFLWANPHDQVGINVTARAAHIPGYTSSLASVTNDLNGYQAQNNGDGSTVNIPHSRRVVASDAGKIFTGTASASPVIANLSWREIRDTYIMGHAINSWRTARCTVECGSHEETVNDPCYWVGRAPNRYRVCPTHKETVTDYCDESCDVIASWRPLLGTYRSGWQDIYSQSGSITRSVSIRIPYNYDVELPPITACDTDGNPPCAGWPNYGTTHPGEDRDFNFSVKTNSVYHSGLNQTLATNTRPSTYEIVSFVTTADSARPGSAGNGAFRASAPGATDSCAHYTAGTSLARGCVVVQREQDIYFNTNANGNSPNNVNLNGNTDNSSYDVAGNQIRGLNPSIVIDDLPAGSKICVAISVWPNDYTGLDSEFTGSTWLHGEPYCLTIAKKPSVQFWGSSVYSAGGISTSQSVKYVPNANGFTASGSHNGLSTNDTARRAFGSWSEYDLISNSTIRGMASGAALGYNPLGATTGGNFNTRPGGFPTSYPSNKVFASDRLCSYSSQTLSNSVNADCEPSSTMGNANITANTDITIERLISRYSASTPCNGNTDTTITIGGSNCHDTSADGRAQTYSSGAETVHLRTNGYILPGNTVSVTVPGKLVIDTNIEYQNATYTNIADLPQMLIFADSIDISPNVSKIDAWLIVGQRGTSNREDRGTLNTCPDFQVGTNGINACNTNSLEITGPVFAEKLALNRTAGAGAGTNASIQPAERFNLRADAYLWSYAQAQRYSQAVVTYTRELAPRY